MHKMLFFRLRHRQVDLLPLLLQKLLQLRWVYWYIWFGYSSFHFFSVLVGSNEAIPGLWLNCLVWEHKYQICEWCVFFFCLQLVPFTVYVHLLLPAFLPSFTKHMMTCKSFDAVSVVFFHVTSLFGMMN